MSYDYWAAYSFLHGHTSTQQQVVDYLRQAGQLPSDFRHLAAITDAAARVDLVAQAILGMAHSRHEISLQFCSGGPSGQTPWVGAL